MNKEYKDEQIGDLEGDEGIDPLAYLEQMDDDEEAANPASMAVVKEVDCTGQDEEYEDWGELTDGDEPDQYEQKQMANNQMISEAVDEFILDKKLWFRDLHKEHGQDITKNAVAKGADFLPGTALYVGDRNMLPIQGEIGAEEEWAIVKARTLEQREESDSNDEEEAESENSAEEWDAETILTTYTNTDNHPNMIKYVPKVK